MVVVGRSGRCVFEGAALRFGGCTLAFEELARHADRIGYVEVFCSPESGILALVGMVWCVFGGIGHVDAVSAAAADDFEVGSGKKVTLLRCGALEGVGACPWRGDGAEPVHMNLAEVVAVEELAGNCVAIEPIADRQAVVANTGGIVEGDGGFRHVTYVAVDREEMVFEDWG